MHTDLDSVYVLFVVCLRFLDSSELLFLCVQIHMANTAHKWKYNLNFKNFINSTPNVVILYSYNIISLLYLTWRDLNAKTYIHSVYEKQNLKNIQLFFKVKDSKLLLK